MASSLPWTVIDFETTGIHPGAHHRAVEVALVCGRGADVEDEWSTLLNPERDIGAGEIHGLFGRDLQDAPRFADVAGAVLERLEGRAVAAHNVRFDLAFLQAELARCGVELPQLPSLCTLELVRALGLPAGRLADCCEQLGVPCADAHSALADARACAGLLAACLAQLDVDVRLPAASPWPRRACTAPARPRGSAPRAQRSFLADLVRSRPAITHTADSETAAYLELLDRVLEDRRVSDQEGSELAACAQLLGLSGPQVDAAHHGYLAALYRHALADAVITEREQRDLDCVGELLGVPVGAFTAAGDITPHGSVNGDAGPGLQPESGSLAGQSVCFTGALLCTIDGEPITRDRAQQLAEDAGLLVQPRVTRSLDMLVVADPDSLSGKARKARDYGTRIVAETAFWPMIGVQVH